jgi:hypothetical protein
MHMLSAHISSLRACSACFAGTFSNLEFLRLCWSYAKKLMHMLIVCIISWCVCSENLPVPDPYAQGTHKFLMHMLSMVWRNCILCKHQYLMHMLSECATDLCAQRKRMLRVCISSWCTCSVHADPYKNAKGIKIEHLKTMKTDARCKHWSDMYGHHVHQFTTPMLSMRISSWPPCSGCA